MAEQVGSIYIDLDLDDKRFTSKLSAAENQARGFTARLGDYFELSRQASMQLAAGLAVAGTALGLIGGIGVKTAADLETARQGFVTLLGSAEKADAVINRIKQEAARTPFELVGLTQATQLLTSVTKDGDKAIDIILDVGESLAAMGKGQAELDRIIVNLQQIGSVGHASLVDIKQFAFAGIPIFEMLQEATGKTGEELANMISEGGVTFDMLIKMFQQATDEGGRFHGAFINQAGSFNQLMANMKDTFSIFLADVLKGTGIFDMLKQRMANIIDFLNANKGVITEAIVNGMQWLRDNLPLVIGMLGGALAPAILSVVGMLAGGILVLAPWVAAGAALSVIIPQLVEHFGGWDKVLQTIGDTIKNVAGAVQLLITGDFNKGMFDPSITEDSQLVDWLLTFRETIISVAGVVRDVAVNAFNVLMGVWNFLRPSLEALANTVVTQLWPALQNLWQALVNLWNFISPVLIPVLQFLAVALGAAIVGGIWLLINAVNIVIQVFSFLTNVFSVLLNVAITVIGAIVNKFMEFWNFIAPLVQAVAGLFGAVFAAIWAVVQPVIDMIVALFRVQFEIIKTVIIAIIAVVSWVFNTIWNIIAPVVNLIKDAFNGAAGFVRDVITNIINTVKNIVNAIGDIGGSITRALTKPFTDAFNGIREGAANVGKWLNDNLNPFTRHSPSLVDWVKMGTKLIDDQYNDMFSSIQQMAASTRPSLVGTMQGAAAGGGTNVKTQIFGGIQIYDKESGDDALRRMSYDDKLTSMGLSGS